MATEYTVLTVEDVNLRLPLVRAIVRDAVALRSDIIDRQERLLELRERFPDLYSDGTPYSEEVLQMEESVEADEIRIDDYGAELRQVGASLVDSHSGLVEFVSAMDGQPAWLSWKLDEPEVGFWRFESDQPSHRRPLVLTGQGAG